MDSSSAGPLMYRHHSSGSRGLVLVFLARWLLTVLKLLNSFEWLMKAVLSLALKVNDSVYNVEGGGGL